MRRTALLFSILVAAGPAAAAPTQAARPAVIAYVFPRDRVLEPSEIRAEKLTHVNFAFANVVGGRVVEGSPARRREPEGAHRPAARPPAPARSWSRSAAGPGRRGSRTPRSRAKSRRVFVASADRLREAPRPRRLRRGLGVPGLPGDGNPHRPEDKENFTALMADLRAALDREGARRGRHLLLTFAAGASRDFLAHTEMAKVQALGGLRQPDDLRLPRGGPGGAGRPPREPLPEPRGPEAAAPPTAPCGTSSPPACRRRSSSSACRSTAARGRGWALGRGSTGTDSLPAERIDTSHASLAALVGREGWAREWDAAAQAPFLWNEARKAFVTYEDEESLRLKSRYVREKGLGGVMFWEYHADRTGALLDTLDAALRGEDVVPLSGVWRFELDPADEGLVAFWENRTLADRIRLPGVLQAQGFGDDVTVDTKWTGQIVDRSFFTSPRYEPYRQPGNVKVPFWLQPDKHYVGPAWYERDVVVPPEWKGRRVVLHLERPHWQTIAWLDGRIVGSSDSLSTPHEHDLGTAVEPGKHRLTIRVDNRLVVDVGLNSHSVTDHTQGNWNGIVGRIELRAGSPVWIEDLQVYPARRRRGRRSCAGGSATRRARPAAGRCGSTWIWPATARRSRRRRPTSRGTRRAARSRSRSRSARARRLWDEFSPVLHQLARHARGGRGPRHARGPLRPAGDRHAGHAVRRERPQGLLPRHARVRDLPEDRPPADRRRRPGGASCASRRRTAST